MPDPRPIGIFDSGIGGLTVASAIHKLLPKESLVYFGDTAHLPYGDKSPDSIKYYSIRISQFLLKKQCKVIVIACNTASSFAYDTVVDFVDEAVPVINVIDPLVEKVTSLKNISKVGVIGTKGTVKSGIYPKKINEKRPAVEVSSLATPLLVPMIEEGFFNNKISKAVISSYLDRPKLKNADALILACTHYPLIRKEIEEIYKNEVPVFDSGEIVAHYLKNLLVRKKMLSDRSRPVHHFYVSDFTQSFEKTTELFFGKRIHLEQASIWK